MLPIIYLTLTLIQLAREKYQSAKSLGVGFVVGCVYTMIAALDFGDQHNALLTQITLFVLACAWAFILDAVKSRATITALCFVLFQGVMVVDSYSNALVETMVYSAYPSVVYTVNAIILLLCFTERGDHDRGTVISSVAHVSQGGKPIGGVGKK